jgi:hypothetical protein
MWLMSANRREAPQCQIAQNRFDAIPGVDNPLRAFPTQPTQTGTPGIRRRDTRTADLAIAVRAAAEVGRKRGELAPRVPGAVADKIAAVDVSGSLALDSFKGSKLATGLTEPRARDW